MPAKRMKKEQVILIHSLRIQFYVVGEVPVADPWGNAQFAFFTQNSYYTSLLSRRYHEDLWLTANMRMYINLDF